MDIALKIFYAIVFGLAFISPALAFGAYAMFLPGDNDDGRY